MSPHEDVSESAKRLTRVLYRLDCWVASPYIHMGNNEDDWGVVFEHPGDPSPAEIAPLLPPWERTEEMMWEREPAGLEPPSSFWPKFEHRFQPVEEIWVAEGRPAAQQAGDSGQEAVRLYEEMLAARDALATALPPDGMTPSTRTEGQAILKPMRRLVAAMGAVSKYASAHQPKPDTPAGAAALQTEIDALRKDASLWYTVGPVDHLNW